MRRIALLATAAAVLGAAPGASAATPETGHVGEDRLQQKWTGEAYGQPFKYTPEMRERCDAPFCDSFSLDVRHTGELTLTLTAPASAGFVDVEVTMPDGTKEFFAGSEEENSQKLVFSDVALGTYVVRIWPNMIPVFFDPGYSGTAKLLLPLPPPAAE